MDDGVGFWKQFRDPGTGLWCDSLWISLDFEEGEKVTHDDDDDDDDDDEGDSLWT